MSERDSSIPGWKGPDKFGFTVGVQMHEVRPQEREERDEREINALSFYLM